MASKYINFILFILIFIKNSLGLPEEIKIGGIFLPEDSLIEVVFRHAIERVNNLHILPGESKFIPEIVSISEDEHMKLYETVCKLMEMGIGGLLGPNNNDFASHIQSLADSHEIPHFEKHYDYKIRENNYLVNIYPHPSTIIQAVNDIVTEFEWTQFVVIYQNDESLYRVQKLILQSKPPDVIVILRQLPENKNFRPLLYGILKDLPDFKNFVVDCDIDNLALFLKQCQQIGIMISEYSFIFTHLDIQTLDLEDYKYAGLNITALRVVNPDNPEVKRIFNGWTQIMEDIDADASHIMIPTEVALIYDGMEMLARALTAVDWSQNVEITSLDCSVPDVFKSGYSIINYMKMMQFQGLTGFIAFDPEGYRTDVNFDVIQLTTSGLNKIAHWAPKFIGKLNWTTPIDNSVDPATINKNTLRGKTITITAILNSPFCMLKLSEEPLEGNKRFEGFCVELVEKLSKKLGFKYIWRIVADSSYGSLNKKTGKWNGMVGEVMSGIADIAVADLSINKGRQQAVAFSLPFMNLGISILFSAPKAKPPSLFSFLAPLEANVWIAIILAWAGVTCLLCFVARFTPREWVESHPCDEDGELENPFTLFNCFFFVIGTILCQGADIAPTVFSTRIIAFSWFFFTLIMISSYTANLATFLIVQDLDEPIKVLDDLPKQDTIQYGCVATGSTAAFFRESLFPNKRLIWDKMVAMKPSPFLNSNKDAVERVVESNGRYAFFMESTVIEYQIERVCGLSQVGGLLDNKGYGIAMNKTSPYKHELSSGILHLQEVLYKYSKSTYKSGVLNELKRKWWQEERKEGVDCGSGGGGDGALNVDNVLGSFVVTILGCVLAIVIAIFEFCINCILLARDEKKPILKVFMREIKHLQFTGDSKPIYPEESDDDDDDNKDSKSDKENDSQNDEEKEKKKKSKNSKEKVNQEKEDNNTDSEKSSLEKLEFLGIECTTESTRF